MAKEIDWETRGLCEELYVVDGLTYEQVSEKTGVHVNTLQGWGSHEDWPEKRREYRQALGEIKRNTVLLRKKLIHQAMNSLDPQHVYAVARLEAATKGKTIEEPINIPDADKREIRTAQDAVGALQEAVELKINVMLSRPGSISLAAIRDMKKALELIDQISAKYKDKPGVAAQEGLSDETVEEIKRRILGVT